MGARHIHHGRGAGGEVSSERQSGFQCRDHQRQTKFPQIYQYLSNPGDSGKPQTDGCGSEEL